MIIKSTYFLIKDKTALTQDALKRLVALESNSFLGSGSVLAYHDLEIRGGGNLLGEAQSGHIEAIGYSLYLKMLEEEIGKLLSRKSAAASVELKISVNAFLNSEFIREDRLRLDLYRWLSCSPKRSLRLIRSFAASLRCSSPLWICAASLSLAHSPTMWRRLDVAYISTLRGARSKDPSSNGFRCL